ncbi:iron ABC transporter permease [Amaricoccus sp.]|uniref:ABC transporter permease n=1 Tax=Amaricoccus sp. TaxID=1872485 RepID=UPI001B52D119|nr:iron ABC transporter permease [Amaricoccus sp.]MBP7000816.1 iron ABC transporter permease [Amaricoccus sp.]
MGERTLAALAWIVAGICVTPMAAAAIAALLGDLATWRGLIDTVLPVYVRNTLALVALVTTGAIAVGAGGAWLVTMFRFPGSRALEVMMVLPLAFPAYVLAYAYTDLLQHSGLVQTWLREITGWGPRDYWFPNVRSLPGAALMFVCVLYPYVYLLARAAFAEQSATAYLAARSLGRGPTAAFLRVSLPMARPAIAAGALLAVMETIADYGTVAHFTVRTFSTGIYQAWFAMQDRAAAAQLALCLLGFALLVAALERIERGRARTHLRGARLATLERTPLAGWRAWAATAACLAPVLVGFLLPVVVLGRMAVRSAQSVTDPRYVDFVLHSLTLAGIAALVTVAGGVLVGHRARSAPGPATRAMALGAGLGYAVPGGVIAVGLLVPFAGLDNAIDGFMRARFGVSTGLLFTGTIGLLVVAYMARFMAIALNAFDAGLAAVSPNLDAVARTLGRSAPQVLTGVHLPIVRRSLLTAGLIVFVEVMKELPATMIMRPFNFDTLAVQAYRLAADERLDQAAVPSLVIAAAGIVPVILVCRAIVTRAAA